MCGILTFFGKTVVENLESHFHQALDRVTHRGPDGSGTWMDKEEQIYIGHRRLSILDLSNAGTQPMISQNGRWVITFNGEIYNFACIKKELQDNGISFTSFTDTEVLLESVSCWGIEKALQKTVGMFAFSIWDREQKVLYVARDRFGEKPCYIADTSQGWIVASELKSITAFPFFQKVIDKEALKMYLHLKYIPDPQSIYKDVMKLQPGCYAVIQSGQAVNIKPYWSFWECVEKGQSHPQPIGPEEAREQLEYLLKQSIGLQKVADVPVGAFLSGGIDSSLVVAIMQSIEGKPVHTFSIGFKEQEFDESRYAKEVANHLQTNHTELIVTANETRELIPQLSSIYDEPYADSSAIPTILVSQLARKQVTVCLSGDAGDEIFGGYTRYRHMDDVWSKVRKVPAPLRWMLKQGFGIGKDIAWAMGDHVKFYQFLMRQRYASPDSFAETYHCHMTNFQMIDEFLSFSPRRFGPPVSPVPLSNYQYAMAVDTLNYLPGDILTKVDRAAMSTSLESRIPLLDHRIVEWAWSLPESLKLDATLGKKVMRDLLYTYVPKKLLERDKQGFGIPVGLWVRDELKDWANDLMSPANLQKTNIFHPKKITALWEGHRDGKIDQQHHIWSILSLQSWMLENQTSLS